MIGDLISCCNILGLEYQGNKEEIIVRIVHGLMDLNTLVLKDDEKADETDEEVNNEEESEMNEEERNEDYESIPEERITPLG